MESWHHGIIWIGKDLRDHQVQPPAQHHPCIPHETTPSTTSPSVLNTSRDGEGMAIAPLLSLPRDEFPVPPQSKEPILRLFLIITMDKIAAPLLQQHPSACSASSLPPGPVGSS